VVQHNSDIKRPTADVKTDASMFDNDTKEISAMDVETSSEERPAPVQEHENPREAYRILLANAREEHHAELRQKKTPLGWAMRTLHNNQLGAGSIYELHNMKATLIRLPAQVVVGALYGMSYDIHRAQVGVLGTPEGRRMERVYANAKKYPNEVEYLYSFVQIITACTASFAHGANDVGNAVGVWAAMYSAWSTGETVGSKADVPLWQIAVIALTICFGFITYGYNIMRGKSPCCEILTSRTLTNKSFLNSHGQ
jgi:sodium-dependent phosphate transporter